MIFNKANKILLGSAQFGLSYGLLNKYGQVPFDEVESILCSAYDAGIHSIDTSGDYGNSELVIGEIIKKYPRLQFDVFSKNASNDIQMSFKKSLSRLQTIYGYSIHYYNTYKNNPFVWDKLCELKDSGCVKQIGMSIYSIEELEYLLNNCSGIDMIQLPASILDRRFFPYFNEINENKIEIHVRSVFLQGVYFKDPETLPGKLSSLKEPLLKIHGYCSKKGIKIEDLALNYILSNPQVSKVLMGIHSCNQLKANLESIKRCVDEEDISFVNSLSVSDQNILNPTNWN